MCGLATAPPDGSWTAFNTLASSGSVIGGNSRYIQYRADLSTNDTSRTPELRDVTINFTSNGGTQAPVANNDSYGVSGGQMLVVGAPGVLGNDTDADGNPLTAVLVSGPSNGSLTLNSNARLTTSNPTSAEQTSLLQG